MVTQDTEFNPDIFSDKKFSTLDKDVFNFTEYDYFPLDTQALAAFYSVLEPKLDSDIIPLKEVTMKLNEVKIDDWLFFDDDRSKKYL